MSNDLWIALIAVAVALSLMVFRNRRPRVLRLRWMWVAPVLVVLLIGFGLWGTSYADPAHAPFAAVDWSLLVAGLAVGLAAGWWRGKTMVIHRDTDGQLKVQASPLGMILILGLLLGRRALSAVLEPHAADMGLAVLAVQDAFMLFAVGLVLAQRAEMYIRARRIAAGDPDSHLEVAA
jgi:hypothetical protein